MWQFAEATRGLAEACRELGTPVTGGNVSFYNQTGATAINPTPVIGVLGVIDDVARRVPSGFDRGRPHASSCSARPTTSSTGRRGPGSSTATSAAGRRRCGSTPSARSPRC